MVKSDVKSYLTVDLKITLFCEINIFLDICIFLVHNINVSSRLVLLAAFNTHCSEWCFELWLGVETSYLNNYVLGHQAVLLLTEQQHSFPTPLITRPIYQHSKALILREGILLHVRVLFNFLLKVF